MSSITLEQVIYAPVPYKGYTIRAKSKNISIEAVKEAFKEWFIPFDQTVITSSFLDRVIVYGRRKAYMARVFQYPALDELKRSGVVSHIIELDHSIFRSIPLSLVDKAMSEYINKVGVPIGEIEPLTVSLETTDDPELATLRTMIPKDIAQKIAESFKNERFRVFILYKAVDHEKLLYALTRKMLPPEYKGDVIASSENIKSDVIFFYNGALIIGKRLPQWARLKGWIIINLEKYVNNQAKLDKSIEDILREIYG